MNGTTHCRKIVDSKPEGYQQNCRQVRKPCQTSYEDFFYTIPNSKLLTALIVITVLLVIVLLIIFRYVGRHCGLNDSSNGMVGAYLSMVALPVGVVLSLIVASTWAAYDDAQAKENEEATDLLLLYNLLDNFEGAEDVQAAIKQYTAYIVSDEFPLMADGIQSRQGLIMLTDIGDMIYQLQPEPGREVVLYGKAIDIYQRIITLRIIRMGYVVNGLQPELWWVLVLGVVMVIFMSFFLYSCSTVLHCIMVAMAAATLISLLFLIIALNYPYKGDFGLDSLPYQIGLANMIPGNEVKDGAQGGDCESNKSSPSIYLDKRGRPADEDRIEKAKNRLRRILAQSAYDIGSDVL